LRVGAFSSQAFVANLPWLGLRHLPSPAGPSSPAFSGRTFVGVFSGQAFVAAFSGQAFVGAFSSQAFVDES